MEDYILIDEDGEIRFVYTDELAALFAEDATRTRRASHVEPAEAGGWVADMAPSGGPVLGPFRTRAEGLAAERAWLRQERDL